MGTSISVEVSPPRASSVMSPSMARYNNTGKTAKDGNPNTKKHHARQKNALEYMKYRLTNLLEFKSSKIVSHSSSI